MKKAKAKTAEAVSERLWRKYVTDFLAPLLEKLDAPPLTTEQRLKLKLEFFADVIDGVDVFATVGFSVLKGRRRGGQKTAERTRLDLAKRNTKIINERKAMLAEGTSPRDIVDFLSSRYPLSLRQIREIIKKTAER